MKTKLPFISIMLAISVILFAWLLVSTIGSRTREGAKDAPGAIKDAQKKATDSQKKAKDSVNKSLKSAVKQVAAVKKK